MFSTSGQLYPIRYVSEETGVKPVTLRAWEKRYRVLKPHRTEKGHRLYSQDDLDKVNRIVAMINQGASISQAIEALKEKGGYELIAENNHKFLINFDAVNKAVIANKYQAAIKEINTMYADYSPEAFAQIIYPALYRELSNNVWPDMANAEVSREIILDLILNRLMMNIHENNYYANQNTIQVIGFKTGMIKTRVIAGLFIANVLKAHGWRVIFCSGVSNMNAIAEQVKLHPSIIYTQADSFYINQLIKHFAKLSNPIYFWARSTPENKPNNLIFLENDYTQLNAQLQRYTQS